MTPDTAGSPGQGLVTDSAALLAEWREQEVERGRVTYPFAVDEKARCEAVRRDKDNPVGEEGRTILYRCGKQKGHYPRHACSDEGIWTVKW